MADRDDELPIVEVFVPDVDQRRLPGGIEPVVVRRGLRRWVRWGAGVTVVALAAAGIVVSASDDAKTTDPTPTAAPTADRDARDVPVLTPQPTPDRAPEPDRAVPDRPQWAEVAIEVPSAAGQDGPETRIALPDGTSVVIDHPPGVVDDAARVQLTGAVEVVGTDGCCRRPVQVVPVPYEELFDGRRPNVELFADEPARGAMFTDPSLLAFGAGAYTVVLLAPPNSTLSPAELELYRQLLRVTESPSGYPRIHAIPPLVVEGSAHVVLEDPSGAAVGMFGPLEDCRPDAITDPPSVVLSCVDGWQVSTAADSEEDVLARQPDISTVPAELPDPVDTNHFLGGDARSSPAETGETRVVAGGHHSGVVVGVLTTRRSVAWTATLGDTAFTVPVVVDGLVVVGSAPADDGIVTGPADDGSAAPMLYGLDASTGTVRWTHPMGSPGAEEAPLVAGDVLVVRSGATAVEAIRAATGRPLWRFDAATPVSEVTLEAAVVTVAAGGLRTDLDVVTGDPVR